MSPTDPAGFWIKPLHAETRRKENQPELHRTGQQGSCLRLAEQWDVYPLFFEMRAEKLIQEKFGSPLLVPQFQGSPLAEITPSH